MARSDSNRDASQFNPQCQQALSLLWEALMTAKELGRPAREFALELSRLQEQGISDSTVRWLFSRGYVEHLRETSKPHGRRRTFRKLANSHFLSSSCVLLSPGGITDTGQMAPAKPPATRAANKPSCRKGPQYVVRSQAVLLFDGKKVKKFAQPAANQKLVLAALGLERCDLIKIDVEGMEQAVLGGAVKTITRFRPVLYVENDRPERSDELIRFIDRLDYTMHWHLPPLYNPNNYFKNPCNVFDQIASGNMLCVHRRVPICVKGFEAVEVPHCREFASTG